jgi:GNAT superfamily N-acetyltransferase
LSSSPEPSPIFVRPARPSDAKSIRELTEQLGYSASSEGITERLGMRGNQMEVFVACDERGAIDGWVAVSLSVRFIGGLRAEIEGFVVDETMRGNGIGQRLLETAENWSRDRGCTLVRLYSNVVRERAHAFYERNGYGKVKQQFALEKTL